MKYIFENTEKCDNCGDAVHEKCQFVFAGKESIYCLPCRDFKLNEINSISSSNKYYVPDLSEFTEGFEYFWNDGNSIQKIKVRNFNVNDLFHQSDGMVLTFLQALKQGFIRAETLNGENIERIGFTVILDEVKFSIDYIDSLGHSRKVNLIRQPLNNTTLISYGYYKQGVIEETNELDFKTLFFGKIKSMQELVVILRQLEIKK